MTFATLKGYLRWLGIVPFESNQSRVFLSVILNCICATVLATYVVTTSCFFAFEAETFEDYSMSFFYFLTSVLSVSWYSSYLLNSKQLANLFSSLNTIIYKRSGWSSAAKAIYQNIDERVEKLTESAHFISITIGMPLLMISPVLVSFTKYFVLGNSRDSFELLIPGSYPFDWRTPGGFLASAFVEALAGSLAAELFFDTLALTGGFCLYAKEFISDLEQMLHDLNIELITKRGRQINITERYEIQKKLNEIMRFHSEVIEFCYQFSEFNSGAIFSYLLYAVVSFGSVFLQFNMLFEAGDIVGTVMFLLPAMMVLFWLYFFCVFGDDVTYRFLGIKEDIYGLSWYLLPLDMQRNMPMMIGLSQMEVYVRGIGKTYCTRELFMQIMKSSFSYFLMLRKIAF